MHGFTAPIAGRVVIIVTAVLLAQAVLPASANAAAYLPGIDVSHWQGAIDWRSVANAGYKFGVAKATEGRTYNDPTYGANKKGATAAGLKFTGYHFAHPDTTTNDAVAEADHFLSVASLRSGNLIPALDMEDSGGLGTEALISWTLRWLEEVRTRLGVRATIYSGPSFWKTHMGNTTLFADRGYKLWIAHYGVSSPSVPANNWGGRGWTFWQWTDCKTVNGIKGCVDADRYNGTDLSRVSIP
jgi:GH25 family lysozyme M1 (1,4-beta-N-acetylmuramidase)